MNRYEQTKAKGSVLFRFGGRQVAQTSRSCAGAPFSASAVSVAILPGIPGLRVYTYAALIIFS
jgi:hypothetical protein